MHDSQADKNNNIKNLAVLTTHLKVLIDSKPPPIFDEYDKSSTSTFLSKDGPLVSGNPPFTPGEYNGRKNLKYYDDLYRKSTTVPLKRKKYLKEIQILKI